MTTAEYLEQDATGLAALVREGDVSSRELVEEAIARIEAGEEQLNALVHRSFEDALARAEGPLPDGPFRGVPTLLKDLGGFMAGQPFSFGAAPLRDLGLVAPHDGYPTRRLLDAGFVVLGRTTTAELGLTFTTETDAFGATRNPWDLDRSTGGSSGGAAAAIAAGYVPAAHCGDGGGSARVPASMTGLLGFKPSRGRISIGPDVDEVFAGMATECFMSRTVRDAAGLLDAMAGYMPGDPYVAPAAARPYREEVGADPGRLKIGVMTAMRGFETDAACSDAAAAAGRLLGGLGHDVESAWPAAMDRYEQIAEAFFFGIVSASTAAQVDGLGHILGAPLELERFGALVQDHVVRGRAITASEHIGTRVVLQTWARELASWWLADGWDLLVTPTIAVEPFPLGTLAFDPADPAASHRRVIAASPYTPACNISGQPAISLPLHWSDGGLPIGVQLVAAPGREDVLLRIAAQLEEAAPWAHRRPPAARAASPTRL